MILKNVNEQLSKTKCVMEIVSFNHIVQKTHPFKRFFSCIVVGLLCTCGTLQAQQEQMYSQYMFNMLHINPAYAGNNVADNLTLLYRNQWVGMPGAPVTATFSWDTRATESKVGYGLEIYNDQLGVEKTTGLQAFYSYQIPFDNSHLTFGLSGGLLNFRAAYSEVLTNTPGDPVFHTDVNGWLPTAGFGMVYATPNWYVGFSIPALLATKYSGPYNINQLGVGANNHYFLTGGYDFILDQDMKLKPSLLLKAVKGSALQFDLNMLWWYQDIFGAGVSYRNKEAMVALVELQISSKLRLGYSYDYTLSRLKTYSKGTHELMIRWQLPASRCKTCDKQYQ